MERYILIEIHGIGPAYQHVDVAGNVIRYLSEDGTPLFATVPTGHSSQVVNDNPPELAWMVPTVAPAAPETQAT